MEKQRNNNISVVIPVYNSEQIIEELNFRLIKVLDDFSERYEIIFVNDHSPDNVWEKLTELANQYSNIIAVKLRKNVGYDNAIMAGLSFVRYPIVVIMDDDLQHAPEDIPKLIEELQKGFDVVYADFFKKKQTIFKNFGSWLNGKMAEWIIKKPGNIYLSPFKCLKRDIVDEINKYEGPFPYIDGLLFQITSAIHQIPLEHHKRMTGQGGHSFYRSMKIFLNFCTSFSILPLRIATVIGFVISVIACCFSLFLIVWRLYFNFNIEGWTSIILGIIIMGGIQIMGLGIIGEYVGRIYMNINRKPQFSIEKIIGCTPDITFQTRKNDG